MPLNRFFLIISIFVLGLAGGLLVLAYFAYVIDTGPPESVEVEGLTESANVQWSQSHTAIVEAANTRDAYTALGYAQASRRTWPLLLYRRAALGRLSDLLGEKALDADRLAIRLRLGDGARRALAALSPEQRDLLDAFAAGVNAALTDPRILREPALVLSGLTPDIWEPWHTIAVERLFAWLGAEASSDSIAANARPLREILYLHHFDRSTAIASLPPVEPGIYVRYVLGSSALPSLFEVTVTPMFGKTVQGACLIGTPFMVAGRTDERTWAYLLTGAYTMIRLGSQTVDIEYVRTRTAAGEERLVTILSANGGIALNWDADEASTPDSSTAILLWNGLGPVSDAAQWLDITSADPASFNLFGGLGLSVGRDGRQGPGVRLGRSSTASHFVTAGGSPWSRFAVARLDSLASQSSGFYPRLWFLDPYSIWAAQTAPKLVALLDTVGSEPIREASAYLRNWDFSYDRASIAASIFNVWAETARDMEGTWPGLIEPRLARTAVRRGSSSGAGAGVGSQRERWNAFFDLAVSRLVSDFGADMSTWRWERVNAGQLTFPILGELDPSRSRFAPATISGVGHPSAPSWGPLEVYARLKPHNFWEGWALVNDSGSWFTRRQMLATDAGFRGSTALGEARQPVALNEARGPGTETTVLRPAR